MQITLSPMRNDSPLTGYRKGDVLVLNDVAYDLAKAEDCPWLPEPAVQVKGVWQLTLLLPHAANAPPQTLFPKPLTLKGDGPLPLPPHSGALPDTAPPKAQV